MAETIIDASVPTFIDAVVQIIRHPELGLTICEDPKERDGRHPSLCVFHRGIFVGKLRWPKSEQPAEVDRGILEYLR